MIGVRSGLVSDPKNALRSIAEAGLEITDSGREDGEITKPQIPYSWVDCSGNELEYVAEALTSGWLTTGPMVAKFEKQFGALIGAKHAHAVCSCTAALHLALSAADVRAGDKVLVPSMTFVSTVEAICYLGATPVLLDVDPGTSSLTGAIVRKALDENPDAKVLMVVHYGGQSAPLLDDDDPILPLCRERGVMLIEDAAHAFPSQEGGEFIGSIGDITCFSFYANKTITTGEGGVVACNSDALSKKIQVMRMHGIDRDVYSRYTDVSTGCKWEYDVVAQGYKYNLADVNAAIGLAQLERADEMREGRELVAQQYNQGFEGLPGLDTLTCRVPTNCHSWHLYPILLKNSNEGKRAEFIEKLAAHGIGSSVHYKPVHRLSYYKQLLETSNQDFPGAESLWRSTVSLPIYHTLTEENIAYVISTVRNLLK